MYDQISSGSSCQSLGTSSRASRPKSLRLEQPQTMLELCDAKLQLLELLARDEAEVAEELVQACARPLAEPDRLAPPARRELLRELARLLAAAEGAFRQLPERVVTALGHGGARGAAAAAAPASPARPRAGRLPPARDPRARARQRLPLPPARARSRRPPARARPPCAARTPARVPSTSSAAAPR